MNNDKLDLSALWIVVVGLLIGFTGFYSYHKYISSMRLIAPFSTEIKNPFPAVEENKLGYRFQNWITTPALDSPCGFLLEPSGKYFLILGKQLYLVGLEAPCSGELDLPTELNGQKLPPITSFCWAANSRADKPILYLGSQAGLFRWELPEGFYSQTPCEKSPKSDSVEPVEQTNSENPAPVLTEGITSDSAITDICISSNYVYAYDSGQGLVLVYNAQSGKLVEKLSPPEGKFSAGNYSGLSLDSNGLLWASDFGRLRLIPFDIRSDGKEPAQVAADKIINLKPAENNDALSSLGKNKPTGFIIQNHRIFIAESPCTQVKVYSDNGAFECFLAGPAELMTTESTTVFSAAIDNTIYVLVPSQRKIMQFEVKR